MGQSKGSLTCVVYSSSSSITRWRSVISRTEEAEDDFFFPSSSFYLLALGHRQRVTCAEAPCGTVLTFPFLLWCLFFFKNRRMHWTILSGPKRRQLVSATTITTTFFFRQYLYESCPDTKISFEIKNQKETSRSCSNIARIRISWGSLEQVTIRSSFPSSCAIARRWAFQHAKLALPR